MSVFRSGTIPWAVMNSPANSASAAEAITDLMTCATERTGPFDHGIRSSLDTNMYAPARFCAFGLLR